MCVTTDHLSKLTQIVCNHQICLHKFCVIITEMLFTQSNVYNKVRFTHEIVNDSHRLCRMVDGLSLTLSLPALTTPQYQANFGENKLFVKK